MKNKLVGCCIVVLLYFALPLTAQEKALEGAPGSKSADLQQRLWARCQGLYTAIKNSQWKKIESFLNEDARIAWVGMKKSAIYGFEIKSVSVAADGQTGTTETLVDSPLRIPGFPSTKIRTPQGLEWVWENDDWYALLREKPEELPKAGPDGVPQLATTAEAPTAPAELEFTSRGYDFKLIRQGETIRAKFFFTNKSDHLVKAKAEIFNPCQCVTARVNKDEYKPGEDGWVDASMETKLFGGFIRQGLEVHLQPSGAKVLLQINGTILLPWQNREQK